MFALLILPILVSGFIVLTISPLEKLKLHRYDGQLLYLKAAKIGLRYFLVVSVLSFLMKDVSFNLPIFWGDTARKEPSVKTQYIPPQATDLVIPLSSESKISTPIPCYEEVQANKSSTFKVEFSLASYIAKQISNAKNEHSISMETLQLSWLISLTILTISCSYIVSLLKQIWVSIKIYISEKLYKNDVVSIEMLGRILKDSPIDYIFYESLANRRPILISMRNRKIYVGIINKLGEPSESDEPNQEISLVPAISGYRDKDTLEVTFKNDYNIPTNYDTSIVIKVDQIDTVSWFTEEIYNNINDNLNKIDKTKSKLRSSPAIKTSIAAWLLKWWAKWWAKN